MIEVHISGGNGEEKLLEELSSPLEGLLFFEPELPLQISGVDREFPISIDGLKGILATPKYPDEFPFKSDHSALKSPTNFNFNSKNVRWGSIISWPNGNCKVASLYIKLHIEQWFGNILSSDRTNI
jgi:hypothetical protein